MSTTSSLLTNEEYEDRKKLLEELKKLVKSEQEHVFRILRGKGEEFSENSNGVFFDVTVLKTESVKEIYEYLIFCAKNRKDFEIRDQAMESSRLNLGDTNSLV